MIITGRFYSVCQQYIILHIYTNTLPEGTDTRYVSTILARVWIYLEFGADLSYSVRRGEVEKFSFATLLAARERPGQHEYRTPHRPTYVLCPQPVVVPRLRAERERHFLPTHQNTPSVPSRAPRSGHTSHTAQPHPTPQPPLLRGATARSPAPMHACRRASRVRVLLVPENSPFV